MKATKTEIAQYVINRLNQVPPIVHEVLDASVTAARGFFERRELEIDTSLFPSLVRYEAKCLLDSAKYKSIGYQFVVLSNNGLLLIYERDKCTYRIRVRKADEDGELPANHQSRTLRQFCKQSDPCPWYLPGMQPEDMEQYLSFNSLNLFVVWDVDHNFVLTDLYIACPDGALGEVFFADEVPHSITNIVSEESFDEMPDELDDIDILPLEKTGTGKDGNDNE